MGFSSGLISLRCVLRYKARMYVFNESSETIFFIMKSNDLSNSEVIINAKKIQINCKSPLTPPIITYVILIHIITRLVFVGN